MSDCQIITIERFYTINVHTYKIINAHARMHKTLLFIGNTIFITLFSKNRKKRDLYYI